MWRSIQRQCPECRVTLTRFQWSQLWWVTSGLSGRLVHPCAECGAMLRLSAMRQITALGALGLIGASVAIVAGASPSLAIAAALVAAIVMLGGMLGTRVEAAEAPPLSHLPGHPAAPPSRR